MVDRAKQIKRLFLDKLNNGEFRTDADIEDFVEEYENQCSDINPWDWMAEQKVKGTRCEGCPNIQLAWDHFPCTGCERNPNIKVKDWYGVGLEGYVEAVYKKACKENIHEGDS